MMANGLRWWLLAALSLGVAAYAVVAYTVFPPGILVHPDMRAGFEANRAVLLAHVFGASVALLAGPFQFSAGLRSARPSLHRWLGRAYLFLGVGIGGISGLVLALDAWGGPVSQAGFGALALCWLFAGARALQRILVGDVAGHRRWMVRGFALSFAAVTLRILLPGAMAAGVPFELAYPAIAWLCWVPNLLVAEFAFVRVRQAPAAVRAGSG